MDVFLCFIGLLLLMFLLLIVIVLIYIGSGSIGNQLDDTENLSEEIKQVGAEARGKMDEVSDKYLKEVFELINQGDDQNG